MKWYISVRALASEVVRKRYLATITIVNPSNKLSHIFDSRVTPNFSFTGAIHNAYDSNGSVGDAGQCLILTEDQVFSLATEEPHTLFRYYIRITNLDVEKP